MSDPVVSLLQKHNLLYTPSGKDYLIRCLNPDHDDTNPSLRVDKSTGIAHCFACGWKANLFRHFGIFNTITPIKIAKLKEKINTLLVSNTEIEAIKGSIPFNKVFRGISANTYRKFEAVYTLDSTQGMQDRVIFPIKNIVNNVVAYVGRHVGATEPRYKVFPAEKATIPYPLQLEGANSAILVEGIFDMLNLYDKSLTNAVCCFGIDTLKNATKEKLLPLKAQGIHKLYIMFDGDEPGRKAAKDIKPLLQAADYNVEIIDLPDDMDPGELSQEWVNNIKEYINVS
jgi:DNA primase